ncbi:MAG: hypothetical protein J7J72_03485 [Bacteroidales bacterium]|nr:hypothetical protein [Bacteroidales bacterium]
MKKRTFLIYLMTLLISNSLFSQDYQQVDSVVKKYPTSIANPYDLINLINYDFKSDEDKARAIYTWISLNIVYDVEASSLEETYSYKSNRNKASKEKRIREKWGLKTLATGMAECEGYATLYYYLCDLMGIECMVVPGTSRTSLDQIGQLPEHVNHAWNVVKINNGWKFVDVTWGAGSFDHSTKIFRQKFDETYFLTSPDRFFLEHFPYDPNYLFVNKTKEDFANLPIFYYDYIKSDYELVSPKTGILDFKKNGTVKFAFKSEKGIKNISYTFDDEWTTNPLEITKEDDFYEVEVPFSDQKTNYLTLYYENRGLMTFKIK